MRMNRIGMRVEHSHDDDHTTPSTRAQEKQQLDCVCEWVGINECRSMQCILPRITVCVC